MIWRGEHRLSAQIEEWGRLISQFCCESLKSEAIDNQVGNQLPIVKNEVAGGKPGFGLFLPGKCNMTNVTYIGLMEVLTYSHWEKGKISVFDIPFERFDTVRENVHI